jgi:hypothetical protein
VRKKLEQRDMADSTKKPENLKMMEEQLFQNGWPNCWGSFNNIMP